MDSEDVWTQLLALSDAPDGLNDEAARSERDDDTCEALVVALGNADDPAWEAERLSYAEDEHAPVRQAVASALPTMFAGEELSIDALTALISLTVDSDPDVRDWATCGLGTQSRADSAEIRPHLRTDAPAGREDMRPGISLRRNPETGVHTIPNR